jgi:CO/xanthine dehydrogenase Mo-binding subunit
MPDKLSIGSPLPRVDAVEKVRGQAIFGADVSLPGQLVVKFLPAPLAHAEIVRIDASRAEALPGVLAVLTGQELPTPPAFDPQARMFAYMARRYVVFQGQPVAAVAAVDLSTAEQALELISVDYSSLPVIASLEQAILPECVPVSRERLPGFEPEPSGEGKSPNIAQAITYQSGDLETGFQESDLVIERTYTVPVVHQSYMEPHTVTAYWDRPGHLTLWEPVQGAFSARNFISRTLGIPQSSVTINTTEIGGGFGGKIDGLFAPIAALLAKKTRRPAQLVLTRHEEMLGADPAPHSIIRLKTGARRDGTLTAIEGEILVDAGAFASGWIMNSITSSIRDSYRFTAWQLTGKEVLTNKAPIGSYRAPGGPNGSFAIESQMDETARRLGLDPLAFRVKNLLREGDPLTNSEPQVRTGSREVLEALSSAGIWNEKSPERAGSDHLLHGRGLALGGWEGGSGPASASALLDADGRYRFILAQVDLTGSFTSLVQIAAQELGVSPERVVINKVSTDAAPFAPESSGSQTIIAMGAAVQIAAQKLREKVLRNTAASLDAGIDELVIDDEGISVAGSPERRLTYAMIYESGTEWFASSGPLVEVGSAGLRKRAPGYAATVAEVAVDPDTGLVRLTRLVTAQDVGCAINRLSVEGQIQGAAVQSAGMALWEEVQYDSQGQVRNPGLLDYRLPTAMDVPCIEPIIVEVATGDGPYGAKVVGETPIISPLPAIANAVADAIGVRIYELPITAERVWKALKESGKHSDL